jgi:hypothetical protein
VVLVFSVTGSKHFQGYARLIGDVTNSPSRNVEWIKRADIAFKDTLIPYMATYQ